MTAVSATDVTQELYIPRAGRHRLAQAQDDATPRGWPPRAPDLPELGDPGLFYDEHGVIRPKLSRESAFRWRVARHTWSQP